MSKMLSLLLTAALIPARARWLVGAAACLATAGWIPWVGAVPSVVPYAGSLRFEGGAAYHGSIDIEVSIWNEPAVGGGTLLWGPEIHANIPVQDGIFGLLLGGAAGGDMAPVVASNSALWLQFKVGTTTLSPRQRVGALPYALRAASADSLGGLAPSHFAAAADVAALQSQLADLPSGPWISEAGVVSTESTAVGVGTATPQAALDVAGGVRIGMDAGVCTAQKVGTLRYTGALEICDGVAWSAVGSGIFPSLGTSQVYPAASCQAIKSATSSAPSGVYWLDPNGGSFNDAFEAYCDQENQNGGWTLAVRLDTNDGSSRNFNDTGFWNAGTLIGLPTGSGDHRSPAFDQLVFTDIRLVYTYQGPAAVESTYRLATNTLSLRQNVNRALSNSNPAWGRIDSSPTLANQFFGPSLVFATVGNAGVSAADYSRIWYNLVPIAACNQGGSIGHVGDVGVHNWTWEVARGSDLEPTGCQHNTYRLGLGTNYDPKQWGITQISPTAFYSQGVMNIYVR